MNSSRSFSAKILLFGEYTVIHGSEALAVPYRHFSGKLVTKVPQNSEHIASAKSIQNLFDHQKSMESLADKINLVRLEEDLQSGLYFDSSIPPGCGAGSSGALIAAIYARYHTGQETDHSALKAVLANLESFYHGASSGLDPLVSYLDIPIHVKNSDSFEPINSVVGHLSKVRLFLVDTGSSRHTSAMVKKYMDMHKDADFRSDITDILQPANNEAIRAYLSGEEDTLLHSFGKISAFQLEHFRPMIGDHTNKWKTGLKTKQYFLKLCGAGGGGFMLGIAPADVKISDYFADYLLLE